MVTPSADGQEKALILWRSTWADIVNLHPERIGSAGRVDHRSHAERGLDEQPTIHEGVAARAMEKKGIISDRCELNRQIKTDNALPREHSGNSAETEAAQRACAADIWEALQCQLARESQQDIAAWLGESTQPASIR